MHGTVIRSDAGGMREDLQCMSGQDVGLQLPFYFVDPVVESGVARKEHGVMVEI